MEEINKNIEVSEKKIDKIKIAFNIFMIVGLFSLGFIGNMIYSNQSNERKIDGLWLRNYNLSEAKEKADSYDNNGDWVFINIKDMDYPRAYEVCVHECSHQAYSEIFAEMCEKDFSKCLRILNETK